MNFDISHLLEQWDYQPGQVVVRKFTGKDGVEKIQLRVDLGILQMNAEGRPDGKRPLGHPSIYDYYQARLFKHLTANTANQFHLKPEDCAKLQFEAFQYHNRYNCLLQLKDFARVVQDTDRNIAVFDFVQKHAESEDLAWTLLQFRPQLILVRTRALAGSSLEGHDHEAAIRQIEEGLGQLREFYRDNPRAEGGEHSGEIMSLRGWLDEISDQRPISRRERLERALHEALSNEDYEKAAQMRDALRNLKPQE
jgi:hypothetical protein